jgi:hypothetical protein
MSSQVACLSCEPVADAYQVSEQDGHSIPGDT